MQMNLPQAIRHYNESHRHYHNLTHIHRLFATALINQIHLSDTQRVAIFFHDIVYDPNSKTNEEDSVVKMRELCRAENSVDEKILDDAEAIILLTKHHVSDKVEQAIVLDLDLNELGTDWNRFIYNNRNIRKEYYFITDEQWVEGNGDFLEKMLSMKHIYNTELFRSLYEDKARTNIKMLLTEFGRKLK